MFSGSFSNFNPVGGFFIISFNSFVNRLVFIFDMIFRVFLMNSLNSIIFAKEEEEDAEDIKQDYHYKFKNQLNWNVAYLSLFETYFEDENLNDLVISNYSGLIVTSKRAALALKSVKFEDIPVYCVGYSTSKQMNKLGYKTFGMESGNSLNLGYFIIKNHIL